MEDAAKLSIPTFLLCFRFPWVLKSVFRMCPSGNRNIQVLPGIMHELYENQLVAAVTCCEIVRAAKRFVGGG